MFISQTTDFHFANYSFLFRKLQIFISQTTDFHFANYRFSFRKLQISISQTTDFHFANYRFPFRCVPFRFVPFRFANDSKPIHLAQDASRLPSICVRYCAGVGRCTRHNLRRTALIQIWRPRIDC